MQKIYLRLRMKHYSVLKSEAIDALNIKKNGIYVDATIGYGGHSKEILHKIPNGYLYGFDQDEKAVEYSKKLLTSINSNFQILNSSKEKPKKSVPVAYNILWGYSVLLKRND